MRSQTVDSFIYPRPAAILKVSRGENWSRVEIRLIIRDLDMIARINHKKTARTYHRVRHCLYGQRASSYSTDDHRVVQEISLRHPHYSTILAPRDFQLSSLERILRDD